MNFMGRDCANERADLRAGVSVFRESVEIDQIASPVAAHAAAKIRPPIVNMRASNTVRRAVATSVGGDASVIVYRYDFASLPFRYREYRGDIRPSTYDDACRA